MTKTITVKIVLPTTPENVREIKAAEAAGRLWRGDDDWLHRMNPPGTPPELPVPSRPGRT
jgi:hypothetical protein